MSGEKAGSADDSLRPLLIPRRIHSQMVEHCRRDAPLEACGILGGVSPRVDSIYPLRNAEQSPTRYNADPEDILSAVRELRARRAEFLAIYHSHPRWQPIPSRTDLETNYYGELPRMIVSLLDDPPESRLWRLSPDSYVELEWMIVPDEKLSP